MDGGLVSHGQLVEAGGHCTVALEAVNAALDGVSLLIDVRVEGWWTAALDPWPADERPGRPCSGSSRRCPAGADTAGWSWTCTPCRPGPGWRDPCISIRRLVVDLHAELEVRAPSGAWEADVLAYPRRLDDDRVVGTAVFGASMSV